MDDYFGYWTLSLQYLRLAEAACKELVAGDNVHAVVFSGDIDWAEYLEITKWSDHSVGIAILFNYFHGMELLLKGFLAVQGNVPKHHRLTDLLTAFEHEFPSTKVAALVRAWTLDLDPDSPPGRFFASNGLSVDDWYEALKYPESRSGDGYRHGHLKYGGSSTVEFWKSVEQAAIQLRHEAVQLSRAI